MKALVVHGQEPPAELLRLCDVQRWIRVSRDRLESLEAVGALKPLRKYPNANRLYRKWQFYALITSSGRLPSPNKLVPRSSLIRRADALAWLGVSKSEFDSWVKHKLIRVSRIRRNAKSYYAVGEIEEVILGRRATHPLTLEELLSRCLIVQPQPH